MQQRVRVKLVLTELLDLFGKYSNQYNQTATAWAAVGLGDMIIDPSVSVLPVNGGFESQIDAWYSNGSGIYLNTGLSESGCGTASTCFGLTFEASVSMGVLNEVEGLIFQEIEVPIEYPGALIYYTLIETAETSSVTPYDQLFVEVLDTNGALLAVLATHSNMDRVCSLLLDSYLYRAKHSFREELTFQLSKANSFAFNSEFKQTIPSPLPLLSTLFY